MGKFLKKLVATLLVTTSCFWVTPNIKSNAASPSITYKCHVENIGDMNEVSNGAVCGTTGRALRMEYLDTKLTGISGGIAINGHVQDIGWIGEKSASSGQYVGVGTKGRALRLEAVTIRLTGSASSAFSIAYRVHVQDIGWMSYVSDGAIAGTTGQCRRIEAIEIKLVPKGSIPQEQYTQYPVDNATCSWRSYDSSTWSWSEKRNANGSGRIYHLGLDLKGSNSNIYAFAPGNVVGTGWNSANGNYVVISHSINGYNYYSIYLHLSKYNVGIGNIVNKGQCIGIMGNTGSSSAGTHLHFAISDTYKPGSYYGYATQFSGNAVYYGGATYYNPKYVIENNGNLPV